MKKLAHLILVVVGLAVGYLVTLRPEVISFTLMELFGILVVLAGISLRRLMLLSVYILLGGFASVAMGSYGFLGDIDGVLVLKNLPVPLFSFFLFLIGAASGVTLKIIKATYSKKKKTGTRSVRFTL